MTYQITPYIKIGGRKEIISMLKYLILMMVAFLTFLPGYGDEMLGGKEKREVLNQVKQTDTDWQTVSISGKLKMKGLPVSPSVKIYMEKNCKIYISLTAFLVGEVGRCEINGDSILLVNKMKKVYVKESLAEALKYYPGTLKDLQYLILGRVVWPGQPEVVPQNIDMIEVYRGEEISIVPGEDLLIDGFSYGYTLYPNGKPKLLLVVPDMYPDSNVMVNYDFMNNGYDIQMSYISPSRSYTATLELEKPKFGASSMAPIKLNDKFRKVSVENFFKLF